jgi:hypothetical protein
MQPHTKTPNYIYDLYPLMKEAEIKVVSVVIRQTIGWHRDAISLSVAEFERMTGLTRPSVISGIKAATERGILGRKEDGNSFSYWIIEPVEDDELVKNFNHQESELVKDFDSQENELVKDFDSPSQDSLPELVKNSNCDVVKNFDPNKRSINTNKVKEKGESNPPAYIDFGNSRPQQRQQKQFIDGIQARAQRLGFNSRDFRLLVDAVLAGMQTWEVAELGTTQGERELSAAQECALALVSKNIRTSEAIEKLFDAWYEYDWRGKKGELPTYEQLIKLSGQLPRLIESARKANGNERSNRNNQQNYERPQAATISMREWREYLEAPPDHDIPF